MKLNTKLFNTVISDAEERMRPFREAYRAAADGQPITATETKEVRIDLPIAAQLPPDYIGSDRLRLEGYRRLASAADDDAVARVVDELSVVEVMTSPSGRTLLDFGQNLVGRLRIRVSDPSTTADITSAPTGTSAHATTRGRGVSRTRHALATRDRTPSTSTRRPRVTRASGPRRRGFCFLVMR